MIGQNSISIKMISHRLNVVIIQCFTILTTNQIQQLELQSLIFEYQMENDSQPLIIYKNKQQITNTRELPVLHSNRICTDLFCTVSTAMFALGMLILAVVNFDLQKLTKTTYPADIDGRLCTQDNNAFNYLYFASPSDTTKRLCVSKCPSGNQGSLQCLPSDSLSCRANNNTQFEVLIYPTQQSDTSMGLFCMPKDQKLKKIILKQSKLQQKYLFVSAYRSICYSAACSVGLGGIFLLLTSFLPALMTYASIVLGGIGCIAIGVLLFVIDSQLLHVYLTLKILFCVLIILIGVLCLLSLIFNATDLRLCVSYLKHAGNFFEKAIFLVILVFAFYILMAGLLALMVFQILAYWSHGQLQFNSQQVHKTLGDSFSTIMIIICAIQFFWGMAFLKQSFDFLISGTTVFYYFKNTHSLSFALGNLFKFHWGSVVAGSFLLDFFYIFDIFYDFLKPKNQEHLSIFAKVCCCCDRVLGLARSDTFSFINLIGQPYCNSARYCQQIDQKSLFFEGSQSVFRFFRISSHVMLASISTCLTYAFMSFQGSQISVLGLIFSFIVNLFVVTFFVSLIAEMAEAISLCKLVESYIKNENQIPMRNVKSKFSEKGKFGKKDSSNINNTIEGGYTIHETHM